MVEFLRVLDENYQFGRKWRKIWPKCIFSSGKGVKTGKKSIFEEKSQFGRKWPKMWVKCIFRPRKGLKGV